MAKLQTQLTGSFMTASFQNVVLTGACGGLGQALARELIGQGAALALVGLNRPVLETLAALAPERCAQAALPTPFRKLLTELPGLCPHLFPA